MSNIWYVEFPTFKYKEDVKELAKKNSLVIVDAAFRGDDKGSDKVPKLTLKNPKPKEDK